MANNSRSLAVQFKLGVASSLERAQLQSDNAVKATRTNVVSARTAWLSYVGLVNWGDRGLLRSLPCLTNLPRCEPGTGTGFAKVLCTQREVAVVIAGRGSPSETQTLRL